MIQRIEVFLKRLSRSVSRSYWAIRLLRLSCLKVPAPEPGMVLVQIDGLSHAQFKKSLKNCRVPFMQRLIEKEKYQLHSFYSGLPSNTPAVQAEIFFGIKGIVPSFSFFDRSRRQMVKMFDAAYVEEFEAGVRKEYQGLLSGGSAYSNIWTGGAKEAHFCWAQLGWSGVFHAAHPLVLPFLFILYIDIFVRMAFLLVLELFIALFECIRGTLKGKIFSEELRFVWLRVLVCVLLRELIVTGACMDIVRGLPIIHLNFLGYDEQAHCRGPGSAYAHWSMKGIDAAIRRLDRVIKQSTYRSYDLWIYSDHGQERTEPYFIKYGRTVEEAVHQLFESKNSIPEQPQPSTPDNGTKKFRRANRRLKQDSLLIKTGHHTYRSHARLLKLRKITRVEPPQIMPEDFNGQEVLVTAMGPLGQIYVRRKLNAAETESVARKLVSELGIPLVLVRHEKDKVMAYTPGGDYLLPEQSDLVFGQDHPFLSDIKEDVIRMCWHPNAGEFTIAGWARGGKAISFPLEYGAHAGMTVEETQAFALLPQDAPLKPQGKEYVRPMDLRNAVLSHMAIEPVKPKVRVKPVENTLRIMSYNVHGCLGMDGAVSPERIARVIARHHPDVVALQELDYGRRRSKGVDQTSKIAAYLEMSYHFHPVIFHQEGSYGNAILSRYPLNVVKMIELPRQESIKNSESRGALWVSLQMGTKAVQIINTHLSIWPKERMLQITDLLSQCGSIVEDKNLPFVLCGDFNAMPASSVYRKVCANLQDCQKGLAVHRRHSTWFGRYPLSQIDHIFHNSLLNVNSVYVSRTSLDQLASDHLPLVVDLSLKI
ncbi:MAG: endonuclease/exonuclease/phosphatase family protein [Candidatus Omnitrophica bacterium]|nr:endonuclease/exonuclease/phosphatase family protein [Candidatus Omnitrophota bacterium]